MAGKSKTTSGPGSAGRGFGKDPMMIIFETLEKVYKDVPEYMQLRLENEKIRNAILRKTLDQINGSKNVSKNGSVIQVTIQL